jgi:hypothetical protein
MEFRFRYLGPEGGEVEVSSLEQLRTLVHDGAVGELTLLYDALTKEWAPARAHAVYRFIRDEAARPSGAPTPPVPPSMTEKRRPRSRAPEASTGQPSGDELGLGLRLSLEEPPSGPDADEAVRALLKEREGDNDQPARMDAVVSPRSARPASQVEPPAAGPASPPSPAPFAFVSPIPTVASHPPRAPERPIFRTVASPPGSSPLSIEGAASSVYDALRVDRVTSWLDDIGQGLIRVLGPRSVPSALVLAGLVGLVFVLLSTVRRGQAAVTEPDVQAAALGVAPDVGRLVNRFASAEESGFQSMVAGVDSLRDLYRIAEVPPIWLEGAYLADAHRYPQVKEFWIRYQSFLRDVESSDTALFRAGFVRSLEEQGIGGAVLSLRLSQAMREFEKSQPQREEVYFHMDELSSTALELHALLVERAADISYEPALQRGVSREPVVEALAEDKALKDRMWTLLERIFASLEWVGGDLGGSRDNLTSRLLEGIEASAH